MRTLSVIAEMGSGGAETVVAELARRLVDAGHETAVASSGGWRADELRDEGVRVVDVPLRDAGPAALARSVRAIRRDLGERPAALVHTHNVRATLAAAASGRARPVLTTVHGLADADYPRAVRLLRRCSDTVVAVSDDVAARLVAGGLPEDRVVVIENAVATAPVTEPGGGDEVRAGLGIAPGRPIVLCVARLARPKRVDLLLDAWAGTSGAELLVVGDGPERAGLERRASGLPGVRLLGDRHDVPRLLGVADLLVLPSDREGLPVSVLEAMAAGVPVVASRVGGLTSLDEAVTLTSPGDASALAGAIAALLADEPGRRAQGDRGRRLVERRFSPIRMAAAYESVYDKVKKRSKGA